MSLQVFFVALFSNKEINNKKCILLTMFIGFGFAVSDEIHQYYVPGRSADIFDVLVDWLGITLSLVCFFIVKKIYMIIFNYTSK